MVCKHQGRGQQERTALALITFTEAVAAFLVAGRADGLKPATLRWYDSRLSAAASCFGEMPLASITTGTMRQYVISLRERTERYQNAPQKPAQRGGLTPDTLHGHLRALRRFCAWCIGEYNLDPSWNPMARIRLPHLSHSEPKAAALSDLELLLHATGNDIVGLRDRAMLLFLADTGCRAGGMLSLTIPNLDVDAGRAAVCEKMDRWREVFFTEITSAALRQWLDVRPMSGVSVFCSLHAGRRGDPLTLGGLHTILRRLKVKAGVKGRVNPHAWRHMFGTLWRGDPKTLSLILGHSDVATTLRYYVRPDRSELIEKHGQYSPVRGVNL